MASVWILLGKACHHQRRQHSYTFCNDRLTTGEGTVVSLPEIVMLMKVEMKLPLHDSNDSKKADEREVSLNN